MAQTLVTDSLRQRMRTCMEGAARTAGNPALKAPMRSVAHAYLEVICGRRQEFLLAAARNEDVRRHAPPVEQLIVQPPARWEFAHVWVLGTAPDALTCARRYRMCARFLTVHPLASDDPLYGDDVAPPARGLAERRVPIFHKATSPQHLSYRRRMLLKAELGSGRALVSHAHKWNQARFLSEYHCAEGGEARRYEDGSDYFHKKLVPHLTEAQLLQRTGYTPVEFWREVHHPNTVPVRKPQLEFTL